jgi:MFS family permease
MKTCPYCGKEYPDDAVACELDQSPLVFSKPKPLAHSVKLAKSHKPITASRILSIVGFTVLAGLCGFALPYLVVGYTANHTLKSLDDKINYVVSGMPIFITGGVIGMIVGLVVSIAVAKADPKTKEEIEKKYVGERGRSQVYMGFPIFVIAIIVGPFFEKLLKIFGAAIGAYVGLGIALVIIGISLYLYDRIPAKFITPLGIIGWMLTGTMLIWYFFFGPGAWGHR